MVDDAEKFKQDDEELEEKVKLRNNLESVVFSEQFKKAKEGKPELEEVEKWLEESEVGDTSKEEYENKLKELQSMLGSGSEEGVEVNESEPTIEEVD